MAGLEGVELRLRFGVRAQRHSAAQREKRAHHHDTALQFQHFRSPLQLIDGVRPPRVARDTMRPTLVSPTAGSGRRFELKRCSNRNLRIRYRDAVTILQRTRFALCSTSNKGRPWRSRTDLPQTRHHKTRALRQLVAVADGDSRRERIRPAHSVARLTCRLSRPGLQYTGSPSQALTGGNHGGQDLAQELSRRHAGRDRRRPVRVHPGPAREDRRQVRRQAGLSQPRLHA